MTDCSQMQRKKVVLYNPKSVFFDMPLALLAVGSALDRERFEPVIIDGRLEVDPAGCVLAACQEAVCLGMTVLTGSPLRDALELARRVKQQFPSLPIVWGGWHPSLFPTQTLEQEPAIDITVQAQGEATFRELVEVLAGDTGGEPDLCAVPGICWRKGGRIVRNAPRAMVEMDQLPPVDYSLIDVEKYFAAKGKRQLDYISSVGCLFRCEFCADPFVFGRKWSAISPQRIAEELTGLADTYRVEDVNFQDETFFTYRDRVVEIAERLQDRKANFSWAATLRADQSSRLSDDDFRSCVDSGLRRVLIGVESGSQEMMDWLKKDIKVEQVVASAQRCREFGVDAQFPFIVGFPGETDQSVEASLDLIVRLRAMDAGFQTPIFFFKPYPGSAITQRMVQEGFRLPGTLEEWAEFDFIGGAGPWVSARKYRYIERFKTFNRLGYGRQPWYSWPLGKLARWRILHRKFAFPLEGLLLGWLRPGPTLS